MGGRAGTLVAAAVGIPICLVLFVVLIAGGGSSAQGTDTLTGALAAGAGLKAGAVPNPAWVPWVERAGSLCPTFSAPVIAAQIDTESGWNPLAVSPAGAEGLAQFEPSTWPAYSADDAGDGNVSPFNPPDALMAAGRYDCALASALAPLAKSSGQSVLTLALDGYNAGIAAVTSAGGVPPIPQTETYAPAIESLAATYAAAGSLAPPGGGSFAAAEVAAALAEVGRPYVWGGGTPTGPSGSAMGPAGMVGQPGFDCSGLVLYAAFAASGGALSLPHSSEVQATMGTEVDSGPGSAVLASGLLAPGDVIAFQLSPGNYDHIGIYLGAGQMVAAPQTGQLVSVQNLATPYWENVTWTARRFG